MMPFCLSFHDGFTMVLYWWCHLVWWCCLEYHLLGFHQLPPKLNLTPRPSNIGKSNIFIVYMSSLKNILLDSIKKNRQKNSKFLLEIHDTIAMVTKNSRCHCYGDPKLGGKNSLCVHEGKFCCKFIMPLLWWPKIGWEKFMMCSRGSPRDLSLFHGAHFFGIRPSIYYVLKGILWNPSKSAHNSVLHSSTIVY